MLLPRLAQMDVHVDQAGRHDERARHLDDTRAVGGKIAADFRDAIAVNQDVERAISPGDGVNEAFSFQQQFHLSVTLLIWMF